ncbi:MAG: thiamine-phosphate kinase [Candidatus Omnitrophica bacterium]|nr:thiamine-phosphate kinase [Candidatus Omnitrophota bacterium]
MRIEELGEFGLIRRITRSLKADNSVIKGPGDDCAVIKLDRSSYQLLTCDMIVEGVDFKPGDKPYLIGRKALAVSISDIAACAGIPRYCLVSLGIPKYAPVKYIDQICRGIFDLAREFRINVVGGDISRAKQLALDVSMYGVVEKKYLVLRSGAKPGDIIFVSGSLGDSIKGKHLKFTPRIKEARFLVENFKVSAMTDISDGLAQDLRHILEESNAGAVIYADLLPRHKPSTSLESALYAGEDFELLFTMPIKEARKMLASDRDIFHPIGHITEKRRGLRLIDKDLREKTLAPRGYKHF